MKIGDMVTVHLPTEVGKPDRIRHGKIVGEGKNGNNWWWVTLDRNKMAKAVSKKFVHKSYEEPMARGITCYEQDEKLCDDQMCMRVGCHLRTEKLLTGASLIEWLASMRKYHEESIACSDPAIRTHIAKLAEWEKLVQELLE